MRSAASLSSAISAACRWQAAAIDGRSAGGRGWPPIAAPNCAPSAAAPHRDRPVVRRCRTGRAQTAARLAAGRRPAPTQLCRCRRGAHQRVEGRIAHRVTCDVSSKPPATIECERCARSARASVDAPWRGDQTIVPARRCSICLASACQRSSRRRSTCAPRSNAARHGTGLGSRHKVST